MRIVTPRSAAKALPRAGSAGGFTLLEVVITAVVASVIFLLLTRWVLTLATVSSVGLEATTPARSVSYTDYRMLSDFSSATSCDSGTRNPIRTLDVDTLEMYQESTDSSGASATYLVRWRVNGPNLTRTLIRVHPETGSCTAAGVAYGERVLASNVRTPTASKPAFTAFVDGQAAQGCSVSSETDDSGQVREASVGEGCFASAVSVNLTMVSAGPEPAPALLTKTYQVATGGSR